MFSYIMSSSSEIFQGLSNMSCLSSLCLQVKQRVLGSWICLLSVIYAALRGNDGVAAGQTTHWRLCVSLVLKQALQLRLWFNLSPRMYCIPSHLTIFFHNTMPGRANFRPFLLFVDLRHIVSCFLALLSAAFIICKLLAP